MKMRHMAALAFIAVLLSIAAALDAPPKTWPVNPAQFPVYLAVQQQGDGPGTEFSQHFVWRMWNNSGKLQNGRVHVDLTHTRLWANNFKAGETVEGNDRRWSEEIVRYEIWNGKDYVPVGKIRYKFPSENVPFSSSIELLWMDNGFGTAYRPHFIWHFRNSPDARIRGEVVHSAGGSLWSDQTFEPGEQAEGNDWRWGDNGTLRFYANYQQVAEFEYWFFYPQVVPDPSPTTDRRQFLPNMRNGLKPTAPPEPTPTPAGGWKPTPPPEPSATPAP
jgi:hypothetical protein